MNKKKIILASLLATSFTGLVSTTAFTLALMPDATINKTIGNYNGHTKHGYNSISNIQQNFYYPEIKKEAISFTIPNSTDHTVSDRNRYVYYPESTTIYIANAEPEGKNINLSKNVTGNEQILDGFAYIATDSSDNQANTFINVFAGDIDLATYFACNQDPFTTKCTKQSLLVFLDSIKEDHTLHLSGLLKNDNQRDNAIISLLNPKIWDIWLKASVSDHSLKIDYIDLSNNNLMTYPNLASIPSLDDNTNWMFNDSNYVGSSADYKMNNFSNTVNPITGGGTYSGYFKGIDLSHNDLIYFNSWAYMTVTTSKQNTNNDYDYYPSLLTIVAPVYDKNSMTGVLSFMICINKPSVREGYNGVNLDYNHLGYLVYGTMSSNERNESYIEKQAKSWYCIDIEEIYKKISGKDLPISSYIKLRYAYSRCFMTYTIDNAKNDAIKKIEYILGWGAYQTDAFFINTKYITNWFKVFDPNTYKNFSKMYASKITISQCLMLQYYLYPLNDTFPFVTLPPRCSVIGSQISTEFFGDPRYPIYNDLDGSFYLKINLHNVRTRYIPTTLDFVTSTDMNQMISNLVSEVMLILNINENKPIPLMIFKINSISWAAIGFMFMMFALVLICAASIKLAENVKKARIRRGNYFENED